MAASDVDQLTAELSGLRAALSQRAVIEQATGLLAGRMNCGLSAGFAHLMSIARELDIPVEEAAYLLLSQSSPDEFPDRLPGTTRAWHALFGTEALLSRAAIPPRVVPEPRIPEHTTDVSLEELADLLPVPALVLAPLPGTGEEITDFRIDYANTESKHSLNDEADSIVGHTLLTVYPDLATTGLVAAYANTMRTGRPVGLDLFPFHSTVDGQYQTRVLDIRARRYDGRLLATWHAHDTASHYAKQLGSASYDTTGWAEWNLYNDEVNWSYELYRMHGRDLADGPLLLDDYRDVVHPEDMPVIEGLLRGLTERGEYTEVEFRIRLADGEIRHLHIAATPITDPEGKLLVLRGVFRDMTASRATQDELRTAKATIERARREATVRAQRALLPDVNRQMGSDDYEIVVKYVSAEAGTSAGGDWYEARLRRDGSVFLAVGDVAGHGLDAAAGMARVGNALRGLSVTGLTGDQLLDALNRLICETESPDAVASAIVGTLYPGLPVLRWAQAGHPNPVLVRDGEAKLLERPQGPMLGAAEDSVYHLATVELCQGDVLLWYTDGLIGRDVTQGLDRLRVAAAGCPVTSAEVFLDTLSRRLAPLATGDDLCMLAMRVR
jgi:serine phosphatase RsbU (regulator of sigma subunit)